MKNGNMSLIQVLYIIFNYTGMDFIKKLLVVDPSGRLTAEQALSHEWFHILDTYPDSPIKESPIYNTPVSPNPQIKDLFPKVKEGLSTRKVFGKALDMMKAVNKLASGITKSQIHLGTDESISPMPLSRAVSSSNLVLDVKSNSLDKSHNSLVILQPMKSHGSSNPAI